MPAITNTPPLTPIYNTEENLKQKVWVVVEHGSQLSLENEFYSVKKWCHPPVWSRSGYDQPEVREGYDLFFTRQQAVTELLRRSLNRKINADLAADAAYRDHQRLIEKFRGPL